MLLEETVFYPAVAEQTDEEGKGLVSEALQDHQQLRERMATLQETDEAAAFETRFHALRDYVEQHVETDSRDWGLHVTGIRLQDIDMPEELKKIMSRQAGAEREKRATITKAEGDKLAAENLAAAATIMSTSPGAMQLRTLQTIDGLGPSLSNTVVLAVPIELMEFLKKVSHPGLP